MRKTARILLFGLPSLLLLGLAAGWLYLRTSLPRTQGTVQLPGLDGPVEILRDQDGVPHIFASTDHDAFFALGYVHAQDRLWQMEIQRRTGHGRLSEILGESTLQTDKFLRTMGFARAAQAMWEAISPESRAALQAYADGVNAWLAEGHTLPVEFLILGVEPEEWTVIDSLVWVKMMAWDLGGNWGKELVRAKLIQALGPERTAQILAGYPKDGINILEEPPITAGAIDDLLALDSQLQLDLGLGGLDVGSNNWVVAGSRTESGLPLLANDPHLGARIPSIWYLAALHGDKLNVVGATFPGLPSVVIGHNGRIAWGVTNLNPDVQDLYIERINPENPNQYLADGQWVDMEIVEEIIRVKGQDEPIRWAARSTRHGPLLSDVSTRPTTPVAMRWTALDPDDTTMDAFLGINYASNWEEFREAMRLYVAPSQNFVYADVEGNIGYFGPGRVPIRAKGDGKLPVPGWDSEYEWVGFIPFDDLPQQLNPASGYIVTANNRVVDDSYPYYLTDDWAPPYRAERIAELIRERSAGEERIDLADMRAIQGDQVSTQVRDLLPYLLQVTPQDERQAEALGYLQGWDGHVDRESPAPAIYEAWYVQLGMAMFQDDLRGDLYERMAKRVYPLFLHQVMAQPDVYWTWCDDVLSFPQESCQETALAALDAALDELSEEMGSDMGKWQWGKVHRTLYPHTPFDKVDALRWLFNRSIENGGDTYTVNVAPVRVERRYLQLHVPSYRQIVDLNDLSRSIFMHTTGQSGNLLSKHYDDLIRRHRDVEYLPMRFGRDGLTGDRLVLEPLP